MSMKMTLTQRGTLVISDGEETIELQRGFVASPGIQTHQGSGTTSPAPPPPDPKPQPQPRHPPRPPDEDDPEISTLPEPLIGPVVTVIRPIGDELGVREWAPFSHDLMHFEIDCRSLEDLQPGRIVSRLQPAIALLGPARRQAPLALDLTLSLEQWRHGFEMKTFNVLLERPDLRLRYIRLLLQDDESGT
ncbi:MAG TPA: hypothetical protein VNQ81_06190 [Povalibacter sp.]|nr:hypothetical protein [Povalibacter sp.]